MARKNLLEAFQKVAETRDEAQRREAAHGSGSVPKAAGSSVAAKDAGAPLPSAAAATDTSASQAAQKAAAAGSPTSAGSPTNTAPSASGEWLARAAALAAPLRPAPVLAALVAVFVLGFVLGRSGGGAEVRADGAASPNAGDDAGDRSGAPGTSDAPRTQRGPSPSETPLTAGGPTGNRGTAPEGQSGAVQPRETAYSTPEGLALEARLRDPANAYTLVAITYNDTAANLELAAELSQHLRSEGFEASDPIRYGTTRKYVVVVGAAPTADQLRSTTERLRATRDPSGRAGSFADAFAVSISSILVR
ncbi:MAG: hypothetical protein GC161_17075 [Planctomycetaceae bacterium]|nr:hypothetical protein [Planctomycetaceae bacterium]